MASQFSATTVCGKIWQSERSGLHFEARGKISRLCQVYYEAEQEKLSRMPDICFTPAGALCSHCGEEDEAVILVQTGLHIDVLLTFKEAFTPTAIWNHTKSLIFNEIWQFPETWITVADSKRLNNWNDQVWNN